MNTDENYSDVDEIFMNVDVPDMKFDTPRGNVESLKPNTNNFVNRPIKL